MGIRSLAIFIFLFSIVSHGQTEIRSDQLVTDIEPLKEGSALGGRMAPFIGLGLGYMDENEDLKTKGLPFNIKVIGSLFPSNNTVWDVGFGGVSQTFNNQQEKDTVFSGLVDTSFRFRWPQNWQVGPQAKVYLFHGDEFGSSSDTFTTFVGAQIMREQLLFGKFRNRLGISLTTDVGIPNETAFVTSLEAQFALGESPKRPVAVVEAPVVKEIVAEVAEPEVFTGKVYFELNQSRLKNAADLKVFQQQNPEKLKAVEIIGYADSTGPSGLNLKISRDRARSVKSALIRAGIPEEKIQVRWVGEAEASRDQLDEPRLRKVDVKITQ